MKRYAGGLVAVCVRSSHVLAGWRWSHADSRQSLGFTPQLPPCNAVLCSLSTPHSQKVAPAQPPKLAADTELGTKPEEADEEVSGWAAEERQICCPLSHTGRQSGGHESSLRAPGWHSGQMTLALAQQLAALPNCPEESLGCLISTNATTLFTPPRPPATHILFVLSSFLVPAPSCTPLPTSSSCCTLINTTNNTTNRSC